jgi:hypothetical protein
MESRATLQAAIVFFLPSTQANPWTATDGTFSAARIPQVPHSD